MTAGTENDGLHSIQLTPHLEFISKEPRDIAGFYGNGGRGTYRLAGSFYADRKSADAFHLCIIPGWLGAKRRHLMKFAKYYLDQDFDVLIVTSPPSSLLHPMGSLKCRPKSLLKFYKANKHYYGSILVHGFSIGAYIWGMFLCMLYEDQDEYESFQNKIKGQIWDSPLDDIELMPLIGSSMLFPQNNLAQKVITKYETAVLKAYNNRSLKAVEAFRSINFNHPYLIFSSEDDQAGVCSVIAAEGWQADGSTVFWKMWKNSSHVSHMTENPEEYRTLWKTFLKGTGLLKFPQRFQYERECDGLVAQKF